MKRSLPATIFLAAAVTAASTLGAQDDPATRSQVARTALRRAAAADRVGLADSAWADLKRAHAAWPEQPAYTETFARWAARRGDLDALERALTLLAAQGTGAATLRDSTVRSRAASSSAITRRLADLEAALAPIGRGTDLTVTADTAFWPEGLDIDPRDGTIYVTGILARDLLAIPRAGAARRVLAQSSLPPAAMMGVVVDTTRDLLWVTTMGHPAMLGYTAADSAASELLQLRRRDGVILRRWRLGDGTGAPGEISLAPDGEVVVSDAEQGRLYRLRVGRDTLERVESTLLRSPQGIAFSADGRTAWIADWSHGLLRWDRATGVITHVPVEGEATLVGIDGLRRHGDRLLGVQNGIAPARLVEIALSTDGTRATAVRILDRPAAFPGEPTVGAVSGAEFVYVVSSQWPFWVDGGRRTADGALPPLVLRRVRLAP